MRRIYVTSDAEDDLGSIWRYIAEDNKLGADRFLEELTERFELLAQYPAMGIETGHVVEGLYRWPVENYVIFYVFNDERIQIEHVFHHSRNWFLIWG